MSLRPSAHRSHSSARPASSGLRPPTIPTPHLTPPPIPLRGSVPSTFTSPLGRIWQTGYLQKTDGPFPRPPQPMRVFGSYALVYLLEGAGRYRDGQGVDRRLTPGDLIIVFPTLPHRYGPEPGEYWHEVYLAFAGPAFTLWEKTRLLDATQPVQRLEPVGHWLPRLRAVLTDAPATPLAEVCRLQRFLAEALHFSTRQGGAAAHAPTWLAEAQRLLATPLPLMQIARRLRLSYPTFRRQFRAVTGQSLGQHRTAARIQRACALLHQRDLPAKSIAAELGFYDPFHFSRQFKKATGLTPSAYRQALP